MSHRALPRLSLLALAIAHLGLAPALISRPAHAVEPASATLQRSYDIPAGPLEAALNRFGREAGILLSFSTSLTADLHSPGLTGHHDVDTGLARLLQGTGLAVQARSDGSYTLYKLPGQQGDATLAPVMVTADTVREGTTEGTGSYTTGNMNTATKLALSLRETPQSVSVLTRQQIDDQGLATLDDALQNITGLVVQKGYHVGDSGNFSARGFTLSNVLLDGVPISTGANGTFNADNDALDIYDRVEVVRGATGLTTGAGTPSAAVNLVRKRPTAEPRGSISVGAGSWDNYRLALDASGPLNQAGTLHGRAVATVQDADKFYDAAHDRNHQLYGILEADLTPDTMATLGFHYRKVDNDGILPSLPTDPDGGFLPGLSRSTNLINDFDYWKQTDRTLFAELSHRFSGGWQAKATAVWKRPEQDMVFTGLYYNGGVLRQSTQHYRLDNEQDSYDLSLDGPFLLFGRTHELMLGASLRTLDNLNWGGWAAYSWTAAGPEVDPYHWDSSATSRPEIDMTLWGIDTTTRQKAVYAATRLNITDPLKIILGTRINWYRHDNHRNDTRYKVNQEITPYLGAIYDLDDRHSAYVSWTEIFEPQGSYDRSGRLLDPITGTNYEAGIKGEYFEGRLNASLAVFVVRQQNRAVDDLSGPNPCPGSTWGYCKRASGEVESKGVELEVGGALTPDWQIMAGYTYVAAKFTKDADASNVGRLFDPSLPRHQLKLTTSYRLPDALSQWRIGGSLYAQDRIESGDDARIQQSGYAIIGLNAAYRLTPQTEFRLNVNNVFDKRYYQSVGWDGGGNVFGTPRNFMLTATHEF
ncbi:MAG: TonB-dependent siderophore receptor [Rhodocyclaceae bacterium]